MAMVSTASQKSLVSLSFRDVQYSKKARSYIPRGKPLLELEVIGEDITLEGVAEQLFAHYLGGVLGESLFSHVWRFEPANLREADGETVALDVEIPMLSKTMTAREPYELGFVDPIRCVITAGFEMIFFYDEGSTTRVAVTVDSVTPLPASVSADLFPRRKGAAAAT